MARSGRFPKASKWNWKSWKSEDRSRPSKLKHWDRPEYREESRRPEEACYHSDSYERLSCNAGVKSSRQKKYLQQQVHVTLWEGWNGLSHNKRMPQIGSKVLQEQAWLGGKGDRLVTVQEIKVWQYWQIVYTQTRCCPNKWEAWDSLGFLR